MKQSEFDKQLEDVVFYSKLGDFGNKPIKRFIYKIFLMGIFLGIVIGTVVTFYFLK